MTLLLLLLLLLLMLLLMLLLRCHILNPKPQTLNPKP